MFHANKTFPFIENCKCEKYDIVSLPFHEYIEFVVFFYFFGLSNWFAAYIVNVSSDLLKVGHDGH